MKSKIISIITVISLFISSCGESQENVKTEDEQQQDVISGIQSDEMIPCSNENEFLDLFPELENLPTPADFQPFAFNTDKIEAYKQFSWFIKSEIFTDASDDYPNYQPVGKYKFNNTDFILFTAEEHEDKTVIRIFIHYIWEEGDGRYRFSTGIPVFKCFPDDQTTGFEFVSNKIDSVIVYKDSEEKTSSLFTYFNGRYYNTDNHVKITDQSKIPDYNFKEFCKLFPLIPKNWESGKQINQLKSNAKTDDFSLFVHKKTPFGGQYISSPVDYAPRLYPLGCKQINDSLYLLVLLNKAPDYRQRELKLIILRDFETIIDETEVTYNQDTRTNISYHNDILTFNTKNSGFDYSIKLQVSELGFTAEKTDFEKHFKKTLNFPFITGQGLLQSNSSIPAPLIEALGIFDFYSDSDIEFIGRLETNRFYILLFYQGYEITSGFHAFSADADAYLFDKQNLKLIDQKGIYSYFSDAGEESGSVLFADKLYTQDITEENKLNTKPKDADIQYFLTNIGFLEKDIVLKRQKPSSFNIKASFPSLLPDIQFPFEYKPVDKKDAKANLSELNSYCSNVTDSLKFVNENVEPYVPIHLVKGKIKLSETSYLIVWQTWKMKKTGIRYKELLPVLEAAVYNIHTKRFDHIKEIPFSTSISKDYIYDFF